MYLLDESVFDELSITPKGDLGRRGEESEQLRRLMEGVRVLESDRRAIAAPRPICGMLHELPLDRVERDVAEHRPEVRVALQRNPLEAVLHQMSGAGAAAQRVAPPRIAAV